jgi:hypothetical protein
MKMPRWRTSTWAFLIFNVVMVGLVVVVFGYVGSQTSGLGGMLVFAFGMLPIVVIWPIGLLVIGVARHLNRPRGGAHGPPAPWDVWRVTDSDADVMLADAATLVVAHKADGRSLVEAAWMSRQRSGPDDPLLLNLAFGDPSVHYRALWPDDEDATEAILARVPVVDEQDGPN